MNKAFIFDMDGVIVNSELVWEVYEQKFLPEILGEKLYSQIKDQILGNSVSGIYSIASGYGIKIDKAQFEKVYDGYATKVYNEAKLTAGIETLIDKLVTMDFKLGLVSSSRQYWIDIVLSRLNNRDRFQFIMSLDGENVKPKPSPDGYLEAIKILDSRPNLSMILEDSKKGVQAAKASGAFTICLQENLPKGYLPPNADKYTTSIRELIEQIESINI